MNKQRGFSLIGAIFVLVIVSLLGQYLVRLTGTQRQTTILALQSARAYQAANAGIEWGSFQIINNSGNCPASTTLSPTLTNFTTTVTCLQLGSYDENGTITTFYRIRSQSQYGSYGDVDYVSRTLEAIVHGQ
ncbi:MAG: prepilin-type N-terminal cleavage/methylation domain-containing protein [Gammaproteobacteria bacterium]|nr:prepilin-type N-terminal cleavage/methylation domain-containing protein [Gammaproteobacteria bacterium]